MKKIVCICGLSASGKDTIAHRLSEDYGYDFLISTTSRPIREGEKEGKPYYFVSKEVFFRKIEQNRFIEYRKYSTNVENIKRDWYYGLERQNIDLNKDFHVIVVDLDGVRALSKEYGRENILAFYIHAGDDERKNRAKSRGSFDLYEWERREVFDKENFDGYEREVDFTLYNGDSVDIKELLEKIHLIATR